MDLEPKHYLLIYALIVTPLAISFLFLRRKRAPVKLNLTNQSTSSSTRTNPGSVAGNPGQYARERKETVWEAGPKGTEEEAFSSGERSLNVFFQWNGHAWDAYETLGIPAGSSREAVTKAYQQAVAHADPESVLFFKAAYEAILKNQS